MDRPNLEFRRLTLRIARATLRQRQLRTLLAEANAALTDQRRELQGLKLKAKRANRAA